MQPNAFFRAAPNLADELKNRIRQRCLSGVFNNPLFHLLAARIQLTNTEYNAVMYNPLGGCRPFIDLYNAIPELQQRCNILFAQRRVEEDIVYRDFEQESRLNYEHKERDKAILRQNFLEDAHVQEMRQRIEELFLLYREERNREHRLPSFFRTAQVVPQIPLLPPIDPANRVIIRVWLKEGAISRTQGHASLQTNGIYASFHPGEPGIAQALPQGVRGRLVPTLAMDEFAEGRPIIENGIDTGRREPLAADVTIELYALNVPAIENAFANFMANLPNWSVWGSSYSDVLRRENASNCCDLVLSLLHAAGIPTNTMNTFFRKISKQTITNTFNITAAIAGHVNLNNINLNEEQRKIGAVALIGTSAAGALCQNYREVVAVTPDLIAKFAEDLRYNEIKCLDDCIRDLDAITRNTLEELTREIDERYLVIDRNNTNRKHQRLDEIKEQYINFIWDSLNDHEHLLDNFFHQARARGLIVTNFQKISCYFFLDILILVGRVADIFVPNSIGARADTISCQANLLNILNRIDVTPDPIPVLVQPIENPETKSGCCIC